MHYTLITCLLLFVSCNSSLDRGENKQNSENQYVTKKVTVDNAQLEKVSYKQEQEIELQVDSIQGKPILYYLKQNNLSGQVLNFYEGNMILEDDETTFMLLSTLVNGQENLTPFYMHCFKFILYQSDGAIGEVIGQYSIKALQNNTIYILNSFKDEELTLLKDAIAFELYANHSSKKTWNNAFEKLSQKLDSQLGNEQKLLQVKLKKWLTQLYVSTEKLVEED